MSQLGIHKLTRCIERRSRKGRKLSAIAHLHRRLKSSGEPACHTLQRMFWIICVFGTVRMADQFDSELRAIEADFHAEAVRRARQHFRRGNAAAVGRVMNVALSHRGVDPHLAPLHHPLRKRDLRSVRVRLPSGPWFWCISHLAGADTGEVAVTRLARTSRSRTA